MKSKYSCFNIVCSLTYSARKSFCWKNDLCVPVIFAVGNVLHDNSQHYCSRRHLQIGCTTYHHTQQKHAGMQAMGMPGMLLSCDCLGTFKIVKSLLNKANSVEEKKNYSSQLGNYINNNSIR